MRGILYVNEGMFHPSVFARKGLERILRAEAPMDVVETTTLGDLKAKRLDRFSAVVLFVHHPKDNADVVRRLGRYVADGGSLLAIHSAAASFKTSGTYHELLGGRFVSHRSVGEILVRPAGNTGTPFSHRNAFRIVDELYHHEIHGGCTVHYTADTPDGKEPVAWTRRHGRGRVCYCSLGHRASAFGHPVVRAMIVDALLWLAVDKPEHAAS